MKWLLVLLAAPWAASCLAQTKVYSPRADSTSLTIYRDGIAQITETRRIDLPAGPVTLMLQGVVDTMLPQSAFITGLDRPRAENNYDFDALTPLSLLTRSVGRQVTVVRTNRARGTQTRTLATIVSAERGVVLRFDDGAGAMHCAGLPERLEFSEIPGDLASKPMLSVRLADGPAGPRTVTISYLAQRFTWSANYVARLNATADRLDLLGWVTLSNGTDTSFREAQVQVVAGRVQIMRESQGGSRPDRPWTTNPEEDDRESLGWPWVLNMPACHPEAPVRPLDMIGMDVVTGGARLALTTLTGEELEEVQVTGSRIISREDLGDYKLYRIDWPTDLNAHQTKQAAFLHARSVNVERTYRVRFPLTQALNSVEGLDLAPSVGLRWKNEESAGLGEPMPSGRVAVFEQGDGGEVFAGDANIDDRPVGSLVEFDFARALDLYVEHSVEALPDEDEFATRNRQRFAKHVSHRLINHKNVAVKVELQAVASSYRWSSPRINKASHRNQRRNGDPLWVFTVPADGEFRLDYEIRSEALD